MHSLDRNTDWAKVYAAFSGRMEECKRGECSTPCCAEKTLLDDNGEGHKYITTLQTWGEYKHQQSLAPDIEKIIKVEHKIILKKGVPDENFFVSDCINEDGTCRLEGRKPLQCRIFPFRLSADMPFSRNCPKYWNICGEGSEEVLRKIFKIRALLGIPNEATEKWIERCVELLIKATEDDANSIIDEQSHSKQQFYPQDPYQHPK